MEVKFKTKHIMMLSKIVSKMDMKIDTSGKTKDEAGQTALGMEMVLDIVKNLHKAEADVYELVGSLSGYTPEKVADTEVAELIETLKAVVAEMVSFFKKPAA